MHLHSFCFYSARTPLLSLHCHMQILLKTVNMGLSPFHQESAVSVSPLPSPVSCPLEGASNFRDIGGYATDSGSFRKGRVYRSDHLADLSSHDLDTLQELGIACSLDFRGAHERKRSPYQYSFLTSHALTVEPTVLPDFLDMLAKGEVDVKAAYGTMNKTYTEFVTGHAATFGRVFDQLLETNTPVVMHCTAGKDRTGFAVALLHRAAGVHPDDVMHDYLLTNQFFRRPDLPDNRGISEEVLDILWGVQPEFLETAFKTIDETHGNLENFFQNALKLSPARREALLERYTT